MSSPPAVLARAEVVVGVDDDSRDDEMIDVIRSVGRPVSIAFGEPVRTVQVVSCDLHTAENSRLSVVEAADEETGDGALQRDESTPAPAVEENERNITVHSIVDNMQSHSTDDLLEYIRRMP